MANDYTTRQERRKQDKKRKHGRKWSMWKKILIGIGAAFALVMIGCVIAGAVMIHQAPTLKASDLETPQSTRIFDEEGNHVSTVFRQENRIKVSIDEIPKSVKDAIISIEDKRFYDHNGIDYRRLFGAVMANIKSGWGSEGGSTITQQVIKRTVLTPEKTLTRKAQEAWLSLKLEKKYSKEQILEIYLNNVYFGNGAYGIKTASKTYFGEEDLSELNVSQIALLVGLPNSPSADNPFKHPKRAEERRNQVLTAMVNNDVLSEQQADQAKDMKISELLQEEEEQQENNDPYNAYIDTVYDQLVNQEQVISEEEFYQGGLDIHTHLDSEAQQKVYDLLQSEDIPYPDEHFETGISLVDTESGAVKAVGGGRNFKSIQDYNYGSYVKNQPGSTIKPILDYGPAIEQLNWPTSHTLSDEQYQYSDGTPINEWDNEYWGDISMRRALEWSRNIPALKAFQAVGKDKAGEFASGIGIDINPDEFFESAAIGGFNGVSPLQMASAYASFGNGGTYNEPSTVKKVIYPEGKEWEPEPASEKAMQDYTAYMITDMLKTVVTSGTGTKANIPEIPMAGKTGSTNIPKEIRDQYGIGDGLIDSWFAGYTTQYSLAVWTGYPSLTNKDDEVQYIQYDGTQDIAQEIFHQIMSDISDSDTADFEKPDSVVSSGSELYVKGEQPQSPPEETPEEPPEQPDTSEQQPENNEADQQQEEANQEEMEEKEENPPQSEEQEEQEADKQTDNEEEQKEGEKKEEEKKDEGEEQNKEDQPESNDQNNQDEDEQIDNTEEQKGDSEEEEVPDEQDGNGDGEDNGEEENEKEDDGNDDSSEDETDEENNKENDDG